MPAKLRCFVAMAFGHKDTDAMFRALRKDSRPSWSHCTARRSQRAQRQHRHQNHLGDRGCRLGHSRPHVRAAVRLLRGGLRSPPWYYRVSREEASITKRSSPRVKTRVKALKRFVDTRHVISYLLLSVRTLSIHSGFSLATLLNMAQSLS